MSTLPLAIVTGAGSGIGRAAAIQLARAGYRVTLAGRSPDPLRQTADIIGDALLCVVCPTDVTEPSQIQRLVEEASRPLGRIDAVVNNAGWAQLRSIADTTPEILRRTLDVNLAGPVMLTAAAWPHLAKRGGIVVNVSSISAVDPSDGLWAYAAAKAGLEMFTHCIAIHGASAGIRAVSIRPGAVETPLLRSLFDEQTLPRDQTLDPKDVAHLIVDCITGRRAFQNGEAIDVPSAGRPPAPPQP